MSLIINELNLPKENEQMIVFIRPEGSAVAEVTAPGDPEYSRNVYEVTEMPVTKDEQPRRYCPFKKEYIKTDYICAGNGTPMADYEEHFMECIKEDCMAYHPEHNTGIYIIPAYCALCNKPI